jgi:hypothetical protein
MSITKSGSQPKKLSFTKPPASLDTNPYAIFSYSEDKILEERHYQTMKERAKNIAKVSFNVSKKMAPKRILSRLS